jgi:predicted signal transduction protein with EAL and GGDEF domain
MFRLLRYFSIASLVSLAAAMVFGILDHIFEKNHLLSYNESRNIGLLQAFANNDWPKFRSFANAAKQLDADSLRRHPDLIKLGRSVRELRLTASIGIALYPEHGKDAETLIGKADIAMQSTKRLGRNRHQMFVEHMSEEVQQQVQLEDEMWRALENNEFVLHYQPVIDLNNGAIIGAEVLLRWPNTHGAWLSPSEIIPLTEKCGLIAPLSEWVLSEACVQLQA